ncbi:hypothetical protein HPB52_000086 [Rhipicephalus sanguineus]|uniref:Uncharacterized protein n=1 Tax=Rhipicephalus sanguineus TaxID=34632 RepID=A0A9D4SV66_RHISA|nr:hypothetical protein HPB52_000086 [Rhipicephalus sanguineus]
MPPRVLEDQRRYIARLFVEGCTTEGVSVVHHNHYSVSRSKTQLLLPLPYRPEYTQNVLSSGRCSVSVWGAISKDGLGPLVRIEETFNASPYCDIVNKTLVPYALDGPFPDDFYWLQYDRSPAHTARLAEAALDSCGVVRRRLPNADALWRSIQEAWEALSREPETSRALYASMALGAAEFAARKAPANSLYRIGHQAPCIAPAAALATTIARRISCFCQSQERATPASWGSER